MRTAWHNRRFHCLVAGILASAAWAVLAVETGTGEEPAPTTKPAVAAPIPAKTPQEIAQLIEELDHTEFARREEASRRLEATGKACISALESAAASRKPEPSARAMELLKTFADREDEPTRTAAMKALEKLAEGNSPAAEDAKKFLDARRPRPQQAPFGIRLAQGGLVARRMSVKNVNGVKEIEADEDGRTVKILDDPNKGICVEVTQKKDGKDETKKYEAKTAAELEKKHPEAHKLYKQYSGGAGGAIQVIAAAGGVVNLEAAAAAKARTVRLRLQLLLKQLEAIGKDNQLQALDEDAARDLLKEMAKVRGELEGLEKKLQADAAKRAKEKAEKAKAGNDKGAKDRTDEQPKAQAPAGATVQIEGNGQIEVKVEIQEAP
ncbi:MAG: hypothetical protein BWX88_01885 [Planctomycetes bacterium ADurb.Bin126]|nr:MAG: hypothetical protein BWX88_01885 [Planctomycetes bacterium ADurb.Bin126]HOD82948.1 hypothetical protein [Phycisphaerae bacterium]HQL75405.1 hypothetical protein [Phycisphaerae bacterium]